MPAFFAEDAGPACTPLRAAAYTPFASSIPRYDVAGLACGEIDDCSGEPVAMILGDDARWADDIRRARAILADVAIAPPLLDLLLARIGVDRPFGHATDLCIVRTARAFAALAGRRGAITRLLTEAYLRRDAVALIAVRGDRARVLLQPTGAVARARRELEVLPTGGPTPLASGLIEAMALAERERRSRRRDVVVGLVTDGQANLPVDHRDGEAAPARRARAAAEIERLAVLWRDAHLRTVVIDPTPGRDPKASASRLAHFLAADYFRMPDLDASRLENAVRRKQ